jgi:glycosyltransferase involved in cell wall biosynthesis
VIANSDITTATLDVRPRQAAAVVPSPVDLPVRSTRHAPADRLTIVSVGRLTSWKGQDVLLRAFAQALAPGEAKLQVVGGALFGEDVYEASLHVLAQELNIAEDVPSSATAAMSGPCSRASTSWCTARFYPSRTATSWRRDWRPHSP